MGDTYGRVNGSAEASVSIVFSALEWVDGVAGLRGLLIIPGGSGSDGQQTSKSSSNLHVYR